MMIALQIEVVAKAVLSIIGVTLVLVMIGVMTGLSWVLDVFC